MLVKVGYLYIPTDFIIMDIKEYPQVPIIVGKPFLCTAGTIIDVKRGMLSMEVGNKKIEFIMTIILKDLYSKVSCHLIEVLEPLYEQIPPASGEKDKLGEKDKPVGKDKRIEKDDEMK